MPREIDSVDVGTIDVAAETQHKDALLKTGALQNAILNSANFAIVATDEKGIIQLFNPGAETMLGYTADEVVGKINPSEIHDPQELSARARKLSLELATFIPADFDALACKASRGFEDVYELTFIRKDGSHFPAVVTITALRDDFEDIIGYLLIGSDNTARLRAEAQLYEAMAVAERANLAKSAFLSSMSHELRTPLNAILGFAQLMESGSPQPTATQRRSIEQILKSGWYLLELINEVLDLALVESGKLLLSMEPVALAEVMRECRSMIEGQAADRGISVSFPDFELAYFVRVDRTRLKQVLINLLTNAIKYNRAGGEVTVGCNLTTPGRIRISVEDSGEGLCREKLSQLFQPFNRLGQEVSEEEGTGIGLVTAKRLIELMDGTIDVESTVGKGSVFSVEMNLTSERQYPDGTAESLMISTVKARNPAQMHTLLYIEDNPANLMLVEDLIARRNDVSLLSATDGIQGVEVARASLPDMILMDINLPGISGIQALKILREDAATAHIPIVALSGNAMPGDIKKGLAAGFFRYVTKPIKVDDFMNTLDETLKFVEAESSRENLQGFRSEQS